MPPSLPPARLIVPAGTVLFHAGDPCRAFVDLEQGCIRVSLTSAGGRDIILYRVRPGQVCLQTFSCLVEGHRYGAQGVAETDIVARLIPADSFRRTLAEDAAFRDRLMESIAGRFGDFLQLVEDVALTGMEARLARTLLRLAEGSELLAITHDELAREVGSAREVVSRQLAAFRRAGLIRSSRGRVELVDRPGLATVIARAG
jgi:CRP/FNR family transcriptional regulator